MHRLPVGSPLALYLATAILCSGCQDAVRPPTSAPNVRSNGPNDPTKLHPAETAAEKFVAIFSRDELPSPLPKIAGLRKLDDRAREDALQSLQKHLRPRRWTLSLTALVVLEGREDVATSIFKDGDGEPLVVMLVLLENAWTVTGFETSATPWVRAKDESLQEYVDRMVADLRQQGAPFRDGPLTDGLYLLEH